MLENNEEFKKNHTEIYWTECSGAIEHLYERYDGIKIPSEFAVEIVGGDAKPIGGNDLYHYERTINDESQKKIIYGFNTPDTFNAVKEKYSQYIQSCIQRIEEKRIDETIETPSFGKYSSVDCAVNIINIFVDLRWENKMYEFPKEQLNVLKQNVNCLRSLISGECLSKEKLQIVRQAISNGEEILSTSLPMELHQFKK